MRNKNNFQNIGRPWYNNYCSVIGLLHSIGLNLACIGKIDKNIKVVDKLKSTSRGEFLTSRAWFRATIGDDDLILRHTSALECLELFVGYVNENSIDVYAKTAGKISNINYHVADTFDGMEIVRIGGLSCTSANQTFNDMLSMYGTPKENTIDEQSLVEALSGYYFSNGGSFSGLSIKPENMGRFDILKEWSVEYYNDN